LRGKGEVKVDRLSRTSVGRGKTQYGLCQRAVVAEHLHSDWSSHSLRVHSVQYLHCMYSIYYVV